jgi:hypothetical protein
MKPCNTEICRAIKLKKRKEDAEAKKMQYASDKAAFMLCKAAHDTNGTRMLTCPCNDAARDDIEVPPVRHCKWEGWHICTNPPCDVLLKPMTSCKRRACQQFRRSQGLATAQRPRKPRTKPAQKKQKVIPSSKMYDSDTSSANETDSNEEITPRKRLPRKSSARATPPKPAPLHGSETSDSDHDSELATEPLPPASPKLQKKTTLTRAPTITLPQEYEVSEIVSGPRMSDGKYLVKWVGYESCDNTWEPRKNLPDNCFENNTESTDESGDDQPLVERLRADEVAAAKVLELKRLDVEEADNLRCQAIADAASLARATPPKPALVAQRKSRIEPVVAIRTTYESKKGGMRPRTGRKAY